MLSFQPESRTTKQRLVALLSGFQVKIKLSKDRKVKRQPRNLLSRGQLGVFTSSMIIPTFFSFRSSADQQVIHF